MIHALFSDSSMALIVSAFIFFITLFMVAKQWIKLPAAAVFLVFSLLSGLLIANQNVIRDCLKGTDSERVHDVDIKVAHFQEYVLKAYDGLKADMEIQKHKLQALSDEVQELKKDKIKTE
jgi:hypothetical protein